MSNNATSHRTKRTVLSFILYLCIVICSMSMLFLTTIANPNTFVKEFTNTTYIESLRGDIAQYANDMCKMNSLPNDFVDEVITYDNIYKIEKSYIFNQLGSSYEFSYDAHSAQVIQLKDDIVSNVNNMINERGITVDKTVKANAVEEFAEDISQYACKATEFGYISQLKSFCQLSKNISIVLLIVCAVIIIGIVIALFKDTSRSYRATRAISYSLLASTIMCFVVTIVAQIIKCTKQLVIYPSYLADVFVRWVGDSVNAGLTCCAFLGMMFVAFACVTYKMKSDRNK